MPIDSARFAQVTLWNFIAIRLPDTWRCSFSEDGSPGCDCAPPDGSGMTLRVDSVTFHAFTDDADSLLPTMLERPLWSQMAGPYDDPDETDVAVLRVADGHWMRRFRTTDIDPETGTATARRNVVHFGYQGPAVPAVFFSLAAPADPMTEEDAALPDELEKALCTARIDWSSADSGDAPERPEPHPAPRDMTRFRPATFWDFITVDVPECWSLHRQDDGTWGCHEENDDGPGELYVDFDLLRRPDDSTPFDLRASLETLAADQPTSAGGQPYRSVEVLDIDPDHSALHRTWESVDDEIGETICHSLWMHARSAPPHVMYVHLSLYMPARPLIEDREFDGFLPRMIGKMRDARIDWARGIVQATAIKDNNHNCIRDKRNDRHHLSRA